MKRSMYFSQHKFLSNPAAGWLLRFLQPLQRINGFSQISNDRFLEQGSSRQIDLEGLANAGQSLDRQQRMPSQIKEIIVETNMLCLEDFGADGGKSLFG